MSNNIVYVIISVTADQIENKEYKCNEPDCLKDFTNEQSLKKHIALIHNSITASVEKSSKVVYQYSCPVETCRRNIHKEFFSSRKYLTQHFYKSHNSEKFVCKNGCERKFSTELLMNLHMKSCGQVFTCEFCNCSYSSNEALITHRKRKNHVDPAVEIKKKRRVESKLKSVGTNTINLTEITLLSKSTTTDEAVSPLQVSVKVSSSTSTCEDFMKEENSNSLSSSSSQKKAAVTWSVGNVFEEDSIALFDSTETQTDLNESYFSNNFMNNFTQTTFADFDDFGKFDGQTQTNWDEF